MDRGKTDPGGQVLLAQAFYDEGQYEDAVRVCKQCLLEHAEDAEAQIILSRALIKLARHAEASELLEGLLRGPARRDVHLLHVEVLSERGKRVEAERALSLAEQTWPGDPEIAGYRARLAEAVAVPAERLDEREADPAEAGPDRWNELSAEWGVLLEAHRDEVPDPISDLREPSSHTPSIELLLPPLSDPLAQGMPPLPAEEVWRVSLTHVDDALTVEAAPDSEVAEMFRSDMGGKRAQSRPTHRPLEDAGPLVEADRRAGHPSAGASLTPEPEPDERSRSSPDRPDGAASSARPEQPEFMAGRDLDRQGGSGGSHRFEAPDELSSSTSSEPGAERPGRARPGIEAHAADRTGAGGDAVSTRGARREAASETRAPALGGGAVATARLLDSAELLRSMFEGEDVEAFEAAPLVAPPRPRGRRLALLLLGGGLLLLSAAACVWYVASGRVVERAFEVARRARWSADLGEMRDAELALVRARRYRRAGERLADEIALLQGLQAMVHGKAATPARGASWRGRAARAARALARSQPADAARALSTAIPLRADDRNLQDLLLAWTAWLDGRSGDAHAILAKLGPRLGPAPLFLLLRGFVQLERGEVVAAERAMKELVQLRPRLRLAQLVVAAAFPVQKGAGVDPFGVRAAAPVDSPMEAAWRELYLLRRNAAGGSGKPSRTRVPFTQRALADLMSRVYASSCEFQRAEALVAQALGAGSPAALMRGELALARGLDGEALKLLESADPTPRTQARLLEGLLYTRQLEQARGVLAGLDAAIEGVSRLAGYLDVNAKAEAKAGRAAPMAAATDTDRWRLMLAAAALARDDAALALREASRLQADPLLGPRARWIVAKALVQQGQRDEALIEAAGAVARCPGFAAAQALIGELNLEQGNFARADDALRAALGAGLKSASVLLWAARAAAELRDRSRAEALLRQAQSRAARREELEIAQAHLALVRGELESALALLAKAKGEQLGTRLLRARALIEAGQLAEAELVLLDTTRQHPTQPMPELMLGELLLRQQSPEALEHLERAVKLSDGAALYARTLARAHVALARAKTGRGGRPSALSFRHVALALRADEKLALAHVELGRYHLFKDSLQAARRALERATTLDPNDATAHYLLAIARHGDALAQRESYRAFLLLEPDGERAQKARRALASSR